MRVIVHIGPHKTGTTYIQANLMDYRAILARLGVHYPAAGTTRDTPHCHVGVWQGLNAGSTDTLRAALDTALPITVLSAEDFVDLTDDGLALLRATVPDAEIVYYYRSWTSAMPSGIAELTRNGMTVHPLTMMSNYMAWPMANRLMNHRLVLDRFAGFGRLRIVEFSIARQTDLFTHFIETIVGLPPLPPTSPNVTGSETAITSELLRQAHVMRKAGLIRPFHWMEKVPLLRPSEALVAHMAAHTEILMLSDLSPPHDMLTADLATAYGACVEDQRTNLFAAEQREYRFVDPDYLTPWAMEQVMEAVADHPAAPAP